MSTFSILWVKSSLMHHVERFLPFVLAETTKTTQSQSWPLRSNHATPTITSCHRTQMIWWAGAQCTWRSWFSNIWRKAIWFSEHVFSQSVLEMSITVRFPAEDQSWNLLKNLISSVDMLDWCLAFVPLQHPPLHQGNCWTLAEGRDRI